MVRISRLPTSTEQARPPLAKVEPRIRVLHGDATVDSYGWIRDSYGWLREADGPEALEYLRAENHYSEQATAHLDKLRADLVSEVEGRQLSGSHAPFRVGAFEYFQSWKTGVPHSAWWRRPLSGGTPELVLDPNSIPGADDFFSLGVLEPSDDGRYVAFSFDVTGDEGFELRVRDMEDGHEVWRDAKRAAGPGRSPGQVVWAADGQTLFFTQERPGFQRLQNRVVRLDVETGASAVIFEEIDKQLDLQIRRSDSGAWLFIDIRNFIEEYATAQQLAAEVWCLPTNQPNGEWQRILRRELGLRVFAEHTGDQFLFRTDDAGPYGRLVRAPIDDPSPSKWEEFLPHRAGVVLEEIHVLESHFVVLEREGLTPRLVARDRGGCVKATIVPDEASCTLKVGRSAGGLYSAARHPFHGSKLNYTITSFVTPETVFECDLGTGRRTAVSNMRASGFEPADYVATVTTVTARDGVEVPISLVARRDRVSPGPLLLIVYGAHGAPFWPSFSRRGLNLTERLSLLDRGFALGIVHARGGSELGRPWRDAAMGIRKRTTFTDLIAAAEGLIERGFANQGGVAIEGASAGGATVLATATLRPDLFGAVVARVPVADILDTVMDISMPYWPGEVGEYGDPLISEVYRCVRSYDPYYNLARDRPLPPTYVDTALLDSEVPWFQPARYVAQRRSVSADRDPDLIFRVRTAGGHAGLTHGRSKTEDAVFRMAWLLDRLARSGSARPVAIPPK